MADASLSLDDIIKKNKIRPFKKQNVKVVKTTQGTKATVKRIVKNQPLKITTAKKNIVTDARNKINQKKKQNIGDARERLGQLAQQGDARERLNKLKKGKLGVAATRIGPSANMTQKKAALIKKQMGVQAATVNTGNASRKHFQNARIPVNRNQNVRTNINRNQNVRMPVNRNQNIRMQPVSYQQQVVSPDMVWENRYPQEQVYHQQQPNTYNNIVYVDEWGTPIEERPVYAQAPMRRPSPVYVEAPMRRSAPVYVEAPMRRPEPVYVEAPRRRPAPVYVEAPVRRQAQDYVDAPMRRPAPVRVKKPQPMSTSMAARMDQQQKRPQQGTKILVNNLDSMVTGEDVEELFNTIGSTTNVRMVKEGVAEVIFTKFEDASKAVKVFNNRQLDGLAMNVKIVNKNSNVQRAAQPKPRGRTGYYV